MAASTTTDGAGSLVEAFRAVARASPEAVAVSFGGRVTTYAALDAASDRAAAALAARGVRPGDRIGLYCINSDAFAVAYFGIVKAGAVVVPVNLLLNPKEVAFILDDSGARGLIYFEAFAEGVRSLKPAVRSLEFAVCVGAQNPLGDMPFASILSAGGACPCPPVNPAEDLVAIIYTSGTTGRPKGAMLTHRNLVSNVRSVLSALRFEPGRDVVLVVLPMFHAFAATAAMLSPLLAGCMIVPLPKFDPAQAADAIAASGATIFMGVPSMFNVLLRLPAEYTGKLASLRFAISGGAALPVEIMRQFEERFGKAIYEGDGPTECSPVTCVNPIGGRRKPGTVGLPVPGVEMKIMDEQGRELPRGQIGELCVRGPNVMKGYWKLPAETAEAFFGEWFRTGDLGTVDEDGYFSIVDRKKDMIIVNGMNVYPRIVEELLYRHPAVREAAVIGEPHELHGEVPVAFISLKEGASVDASALRAFCLESLGRHEVPRRVVFLPDLPKNAAGKIMKRALRKDGERERGVP
ncbi:MAG TPA: long-chain fatty acid--CoA ligase [Kiritimatiellia bacterium]|nr:long-chain fatty acid--CoA ligase [Kiritimatiellia bacterium]HRZ11311.1 long-chain fatty acid--CoA ligase [Kiritimatiellia bacterium]HSA17138.1 long-chain fatty acid--CoA ligase [Kiritimatiellia bacterium]